MRIVDKLFSKVSTPLSVVVADVAAAVVIDNFKIIRELD